MSRTARPPIAADHNRHARGREKLLAHIAMLLFAALIAGSFSFGGMAVRHLDAGPLTLMRYIMSVMVMGVLTFLVLKVPFSRPRAIWRFVILGALIATYMLTMFIALEFTSPVQKHEPFGAEHCNRLLDASNFPVAAVRQRRQDQGRFKIITAGHSQTERPAQFHDNAELAAS